MHLREIILNRLKENQDEFISGQELADEFSVSKVAIWKHIEVLKEQGYNIEAVRNRGYRLAFSPFGFHAALAQAGLTTKFLGQQLDFYPQVSSTIEVVKQKLTAGKSLPHGYTVVAGRQQTGKAKKGASWDSPPGGLWFSCLFLPMLPVTQLSLFSAAFSTAVAEGLEALTGLNYTIHWPNDIYCAGNKICGMLLESQGEMERIRELILGLGVYVNCSKEAKEPVSLELLTGRTYDLSQLCALLLNRLETEYVKLLDQGPDDLLNRYKQRLHHLGQIIEIVTSQGKISGRHVDIDRNNFLILEDDRNEFHTIPAGDIIP